MKVRSLEQMDKYLTIGKIYEVIKNTDNCFYLIIDDSGFEHFFAHGRFTVVVEEVANADAEEVAAEEIHKLKFDLHWLSQGYKQLTGECAQLQNKYNRAILALIFYAGADYRCEYPTLFTEGHYPGICHDRGVTAGELLQELGVLPNGEKTT